MCILYDAMHQGRGAEDSLETGVKKASIAKVGEAAESLLLGLAVAGIATTTFQASV